MRRTLLIIFSLLCFFPFGGNCQYNIITTIAGDGTPGFSGDNGPAIQAKLNTPMGLALDTFGNLYISDKDNHRVRKIDLNGIITTVAGVGVAGSSGENIPAQSAQLNQPRGVVVDKAGNIFIAEFGGQRVRRVDVNGIIKTYAGTGVAGYNGKKHRTQAEIQAPWSLVLDAAENLYIGEFVGRRVRVIASDDTMYTVAGDGTQNTAYGVLATTTGLDYISGVAMDDTGNLYISQLYASTVSKVDIAGIIHKVSGTGNYYASGDGGPALLADNDNPGCIVADTSGIYIVEQGDLRIRKINNAGIIDGYAGTGEPGCDGDGGAAIDARMNPAAIVRDKWGRMYIAGDHRIRMLDTAQVPASVRIMAEKTKQMQVYPNPSQGAFNVVIPAANTKMVLLTITDMSGRKVKEVQVQTNAGEHMQLNVQPGVYFLSAGTGRERWKGKVIVQ